MNNEILLLCQFFYPEHVSSAVLPFQLAESLVKNGKKVDVLCGMPQEFYNDRSKIQRSELYSGINIKRVHYGKFNSKAKIGRMINFFSFFMSVLFKIPTILKYKVIIVYTNPPILPIIAYWVKKLSKSKLVFVGFDLYPDNAIALKMIKQNGFIVKIMKYINKRVYSDSDKVVAISDDMKDYMLNTHKELDEKRVAVIPNWYTGEAITSKTIVNSEFAKLRASWKLILLYTGNMGEAQDLDTIVESIILMKNNPKYSDVLFIFTGHGSRKREIEQKLIKNGVSNVVFYGFLKDQDYIDVMNIADICLVSLKRGIDGLGVPSKAYGYFAFAKPVISIMAKEDELAYNIKEHTAGFNVEQGDQKGFIETVGNFITDSFLIETCRNGSANLHNLLYQKDISLKKYNELIDELLQ